MAKKTAGTKPKTPSRTKKDPGQLLEIEGRTVKITNLDKLFFPAASFTKGQMIDYYIRASRFVLPHLKDRPVTLKRYPDGIEGEFFYEKDAPGYTPEWVQTYPVPRRAGGTPIRYILVNDLPTLVWCANIATIEFHPFLHRAPHIDTPVEIVFDLDPGEGSSVLKCAEVAFILREVLDELGLKSFPKMSGSKGIQIYVPLNPSPGKAPVKKRVENNVPCSYDMTQQFARKLAQLLETQHPKLIIAEMAKPLRKNKVFIDWSQNSDFKTTVGVYSMRAKRTTPFISLPVSWDELEQALNGKDSSGLYFHPGAALERFEKTGDLFEPVLKLRQRVPDEVARLFANRSAAPSKAKAKTGGPTRQLAEYRRKRDFTQTPEPAAAPRASHQGGRRRFVIQKHAASHLHYDFRLEMHGVLKSWAVPKGVPYVEGEKRLAMATEDHPSEYIDFEGTIPQGQYGGGTVMIWDTGTYEIVEGNYYKGRLRIFIDGRKLHGEWLLVKDASEDRKWQLIKIGPSMKPLAPKTDNVSGVSGRTLEQIAEAKDATWHSNRAPAGIAIELDRLPPSKLAFIEPMKAQLVAALPEEEGWEYEIKLDGYRALAMRSTDRVQLLSRRNNDLSGRFAEIAKACEALEPDMIVDGEVVAVDENGRPSFNLLQNYQTTSQPILYYVFDLLVYRGRSLLKVPLRDRRQLLNAALKDIADPVRVLGALEASPRDLVAAAKEQDIEGFVAKRLNSVYEPGNRSGAWLKFKVNKSQELIIGGYIPGKDGFESLLAGYYEGGKLLFIGKIKNGFMPRIRRDVAGHFHGLGTEVCPFANLPEAKNARRGEALTAPVMKKCCWLKPELVAQVEFTDWTEANHLRHSRFVALRDDKDPREVMHEVETGNKSRQV